MGGGTGTGAAPIIADIGKRLGALTVGVVTKPFTFEGKRRRRLAEKGIDELRQAVDTLIVVPNDRLLELADETTSMLDAFKMADQVLYNAVKAISDIITQQGVVNVDFADAVSVMHDKGMALMGIGVANGERRAVEAAQQAVASPLLEDISIDGAMGILVNVTGGATLTLHEVNASIALITEAAHDEAEIIFGYVVDDAMGEDVAITVIATGFNSGQRSSVPEEEQVNTRIPSHDIPTFIRKKGRDVHWEDTAETVQNASVAPMAMAGGGTSEVFASEEGSGMEVATQPGVPLSMEEDQGALVEELGDTYPPQPNSSPAISILPPVEERAYVTHPSHSAKPMGRTVVEEDQYDIPAFLRRNAE